MKTRSIYRGPSARRGFLAATIAFAGAASAYAASVSLDAPETSIGDLFGYSVDVDGDRAVVGAFNDTGNAAFAGAAYVFERDDAGWTRRAVLVADDGVAGDLFGRNVAISGETIVVGASKHDVQKGAIYVFERNAGGADAWGQTAKLVSNDLFPGDEFGVSVDIDGDTIVAGAWLDDDLGPDSGGAYVFERVDGVWIQTRKLLQSDGERGDQLGCAAAIDGDTILVGAFREEDNGDDAGAAYVFGRDVGGTEQWGEVAKLLADDGAAGDRFALAVALDGDRALVGAPDKDDDRGAVYVFARNTGGTDAWGAVTRLDDPFGRSGDRLGDAVAMAGDRAVVGAPIRDTAAPDTGAALVFVRGGDGTWAFDDVLVPDGAASNDAVGVSVAIDAGRLVVGAPNDDDKGFAAGAAFIFELAAPCPGDLDGDGAVAFADLLAVLAAWGPCNACAEDLDADGTVGFDDLLAILAAWGPCEP